MERCKWRKVVGGAFNTSKIEFHQLFANILFEGELVYVSVQTKDAGLIGEFARIKTQENLVQNLVNVMDDGSSLELEDDGGKIVTAHLKRADANTIKLTFTARL